MADSIAELSTLIEKTDDTPDSHLLMRISAAQVHIEHLAELAISAASQALRVAIASGQALEILFRRHEGEFAEWLAGAIPKKADGGELLCEKTARRYRTLWKKRDILFPPDGSEPPCRSLTEAYIKLGILPEPEAAEHDPNAVHSAFRLSYSLPSGDPETWAPADRRAFLTKAEPIVEAWNRARELIGAT